MNFVKREDILAQMTNIGINNINKLGVGEGADKTIERDIEELLFYKLRIATNQNLQNYLFDVFFGCSSYSKAQTILLLNYLIFARIAAGVS